LDNWENDMRKWNSEIFKNNHLRLMKCHIGMAIFYFCLFGFFTMFAQTERTESFVFVLVKGFYFLLILIHLALSYGSYRRIELSRKASEIVFALVLVTSPIGNFLSTFLFFLSMYLFLPATMWQAPDDNESSLANEYAAQPRNVPDSYMDCHGLAAIAMTRLKRMNFPPLSMSPCPSLTCPR
jgi:hypothetical protein